MSYEKRNIALVCNPFHTKALVTTESISLLLLGMNVKHEIFNQEWPAQWHSFSEVWIVGGDGTLNYFINRNRDIKIPLAVFKGGTGNDFHWMLYGEITVEEQVERVLEGRITHLDSGKCNERYFLNNLGIGFDAKVSQQLIGKKKKKGKASYFITILKNIFFFREFKCKVQYAGQQDEKKFFMIGVANGKRSGGGFHLAPDALLDDGFFDLNLIGKINPFKRLRYLPAIEKGMHTKLSFIKHFKAREVKINAAKELHAHVDGEYFTSSSFDIQCLPKRFAFLW